MYRNGRTKAVWTVRSRCEYIGQSRHYQCTDRHLYRNICFTTSCPETLNSCHFRLRKKNNQENTLCTWKYSSKRKIQKRTSRPMQTVTLNVVFVQNHHDLLECVMGWAHYTDVKSDQWILTDPRCAMDQELSRDTQLADMWRLSRCYVVWYQSSSQK